MSEAVLHPVACHCRGFASDASCRTRWNGLIGATNCLRRRPHRRHPWIDEPANTLYRCRGVTVRAALRGLLTHVYK